MLQSTGQTAGTFDLPVVAVRPYGIAVARRALGTWTRLEEVELVKTWFVVGSAAAVTAVGVALPVGMDDIRRFRQMRKM